MFTKAFNRISNLEKAINGFRAAGIWPIDTTEFDEHFVDVASPSENTTTDNNLQSNIVVTPDRQTISTLDYIQQRPVRGEGIKNNRYSGNNFIRGTRPLRRYFCDL